MRWTTSALALALAAHSIPVVTAFVLPWHSLELASDAAVQAAVHAGQEVAHSIWKETGPAKDQAEQLEKDMAMADVQVFRFQAGDGGWDAEAIEHVRGVAESLDLDIWHASRDRLDILVRTSQIYALESALPAGLTLGPTLLSSGDLSALISAERSASASFAPDITAVGSGGWNVSTLASTFHDAYRPLEDVSAFLDALVTEFPGANKIVVGTSAEGRPIEALQVHRAGKGKRETDGKKWARWSERYVDAEEGERDDRPPEIFLMGGQHAREWISPATLLYFAHALLVQAQTDDEVARLLERFVFTIVPSINPDGYVFSHGRSRLWKKNRQATNGRCVGIDMNANWGYKWSSKPSLAAGVTPCSDSYPGAEAFQAVETRAIADYITAPERNMRAFVDIHSYGQLFMFPYSYSCSDFPKDAEVLMEAGLGVAKSIKADHGTVYKTGQACDLVYRMAGDSIDFAYGEAGVRWAYSAELRDTGTYGFLLPAHLIRPTAEEMASGLLYLVKFIRANELGPR